MASAARKQQKICFESFEADPATGELHKDGAPLRISEQPFQILVALLEKPGELLTRDELKERLWPDDTFVEFNDSLNTAVNKLRQSLGDSARNPKYIETLQGRGYRFVGEIRSEETSEAPSTSRPPSARWKTPLIALGTALLGAMIATLWGSLDDGSRSVRKFRLSIGPNVTAPVISPNGRHIAYVEGEDRSLWVQDLDQDEPRLLEGAQGARRPFWSPDSETLGFAVGGKLMRLPQVGGAIATICGLPSPHFEGADWSPDGETIIFGSGSQLKLYRVAARGGEPTVLPGSKPGLGAHLTSPHFLPSALPNRILYDRGSSKIASRQIAVLDLETGNSKTCFRAPGQSIPRAVTSSSCGTILSYGR